MWEELWDGGTQPPPPTPPKGGEPLIKANLLKKNQEKTKMPSPRVERFTAILGFVKNG